MEEVKKVTGDIRITAELIRNRTEFRSRTDDIKKFQEKQLIIHLYVLLFAVPVSYFKKISSHISRLPSLSESGLVSLCSCKMLFLTRPLADRTSSLSPRFYLSVNWFVAIIIFIDG